MGYQVFVSHASRERHLADAICVGLEATDIRCWIAPRDIPPGAEWANAIIKGLESCEMLLLVLSGESVTSQHVLREVERAVNRRMPIMPVRVDDIVPTGSMSYYLGAVHWLDASTPPFEEHLDDLVERVGRTLRAGPNRAAPPTTGRSATSDLRVEVGEPRLLVDSASRAELRDFRGSPDLGTASAAIEKMLMALGARAARVGSPTNEMGGRSTYLSVRVQAADDLFFDSVHLDVWRTPEVELRFFTRGEFADPARVKALVASPEVNLAAGDVIRIVHPDARGEPFMTHRFYDDESGHVTISLEL